MDSQPPVSPSLNSTTEHGRLAQWRAKLLRHEKYFPAAFFGGGVLFDILTTGRIDDWFSIGTQLVYLALCALLLQHMVLEDPGAAEKEVPKKRIMRWYYTYRTEALHFAFGALLSVYSIFYFKSSSIMVSGTFLILLILLMLANELERFKKLGLEIKFALLTLCWISLFSFLIPILIGTSGTWVFVASVFAGAAPVLLQAKWAGRAAKDPERVKSTIRLPAAAVVLAFLGLYFLGLVPPLPLSAQYMGMYHKVERAPGGAQFVLSHERPWWKFWHKGDQLFLAAPGDKLNLFFRLFSPANFKDQIFVKWYIKETNGEWSLQDRISIPIYGGRDEGYRGYATKGNYRPGEWKATLETADYREISRLYFTVETIPGRDQPFLTETY